jgi:hypothetical protein
MMIVIHATSLDGGYGLYCPWEKQIISLLYKVNPSNSKIDNFFLDMVSTSTPLH